MKIKMLWDDLSRWSQKTFGDDSKRGPIGSLKGLKLEADEAIQSGEIEEFADCFIFILDAARRAGLTYIQLIDAAIAKLKVNETRMYPKPLADETVHHIERCVQ